MISSPAQRRGSERSSLHHGLAAYWKMEEAAGTRYDSSGRGNHLTSNNSVGQAPGIIGNAASFVAASSQYLSVASNPSLNTFSGGWTIAGWVNPTDANANRGIIGKWDAAGQLSFILLQLGTHFYIQTSPDGSASGNSSCTAGTVIAGAWAFLVVSFDPVAGQLSLSVNNAAPVTAACSAIFSSTSIICVGLDRNDAWYWNGLIDEMGLWTRALKVYERTALWNNGSGRTYPWR